jgi:hypothetical protein
MRQKQAIVQVFRRCTRAPPAANRALGVLGVPHVTVMVACTVTATARNALATSRPVAVRPLKCFADDITDQKDRVSWVQIPAYEEVPPRAGQQAPAGVTLPHITSTNGLISLYTDNSM